MTITIEEIVYQELITVCSSFDRTLAKNPTATEISFTQTVGAAVIDLLTEEVIKIFNAAGWDVEVRPTGFEPVIPIWAFVFTRKLLIKQKQETMFKTPKEIKQQLDLTDNFIIQCVNSFSKGAKSVKDGKIQVQFGVSFDIESAPGCMETLEKTMKQSGWDLDVKQSAFETWPTGWNMIATEL